VSEQPTDSAPVSARGIGYRFLIFALVAALVLIGTAVGLSLAYGDTPITGPFGEGAWTARSRAWFTARGVYPPELDAQASRHFAWTRTQGAIVIPALDRAASHRVKLDVRGIASTPTRPAQELAMQVDGLVVSRVTLTGAPQAIEVIVPPSRRNAATVGFHLSHGFVPGPSDPRELGMIIDTIAIAPAAGERWPLFTAATGRALLCALLLAAMLALIAQVSPATLTLAAAGAAGTALLVAYDGAFLGGVLIGRLIWVHAGVVAAAALVAGVRAWGGMAPDRALAVGFAAVAVVFVLRAGVFLHPHVTVGDSIFHVHRAELVARKSYLFTSVTPRPFFEFPYPPGLYVAAMPLWDDVRDQPGRVRLLRVIALATDALAALALFAAVRRHWGAAAGVTAAGLHQLVPIGLHTICTSNLTNAFAQSVFTLGIAVALWLVGKVKPVVWAPILAACVTAGFLSHFSTLATGAPILAAIAAALAVTRPTRGLGVWVAGVLVASLLVSYVVYYSHFHQVYRTTIERVMAREGHAAERSMVAPITVKVSRFVYAVRTEYFGVPLAAAAMAGLVVMLRRRLRDPLSLAAAGWLAVVLAYFLLGILTPIEMRAALAGQPLIAALAGLAIGTALDWRRMGAPLAAAVVLAVVWRGVHDWLLCLGIV
jgi:hypothetical protein